MWHKEERDAMHRGQNMNFDSVGPEVPFVQNIRFPPVNNGPGMQFFPDASRKRKTMEHLGGYANDVAAGFENLGGNMGNRLQGEYGFQNNVVLPLAVVSPLNTPEMYFDHNSGYAKPSNSEFHHGNGQFYATENSLLRSETKGDCLNRSSFGSCNLQPFYHSESSFPVEVPARNITGPHDLQHLAYDPVSQSEPGKFMSYFGNKNDFKEMSEGALRSPNATTLGHERNSQLCNPCPYPWTTSKILPYTDSSHSRMVSEKFLSYGGTDVQNFNRSGQGEVRAPDQETWFKEGGITSSGTTISTQASVICERREAYDFSRYHSSEIRSRSNDISSAQLLNVRDKEQSGGTIPQLPESSFSIEASADNRMVNNSTNASKDSETEVLKNVYGSVTENKNDTLVEGASLERDNSLASRPVEHSDELPLNSEEQRGSVAGSPMIIEKLWDGSLQLNTSTTVSAIAFFKSGEKAQDIKWPEQVEIKGKVRLQAFEKFIQELPRSRNRALMVISLCWKAGSSKAGLTGIKEVAKGYRESERLGFAQICPSFDLYVCPRSDIIITILAKSGFFKGMAAVEEDQDSLIGCVVWRRGHISSNPTPKISDRKKVALQDEPSNSPDPSVPEINSPVMVVQESESNQEKPPSSLISETRSIPLDSSGPKMPKTMVIQPSNDSSHDASNFHANGVSEIAVSVPYNSSNFHANGVSEIAVSVPYNSPLIQNQVPSTQIESVNFCGSVNYPNITITQAAETESVNFLGSENYPKITITQAAESKRSDAEAKQALLPGPPPRLDGIQQPADTQFSMSSHSHNSYYSGPAQEFRASASLVASPLIRDQLSMAQKPDISFVQPMQSDLKAKVAQPALPGPPPLPPDLLQKIIQFKKDGSKVPTEGVSANWSMMGIGERKKPDVGFESQQRSADLDDDDGDLPEFDFDAACGVSKPPPSNLSWSTHRTHFPVASFSDQPPVEEVKHEVGPMLPLSAKLVEVVHKQQDLCFPGKPWNTYQGTTATLPTRVGELTSDKKRPQVQAWRQHFPVKADKDSTLSCTISQKSRWNDEDDDDMPEWCPPDLEHPDHKRSNTSARLPLPILRPAPDNGAPMIPDPSEAFYGPPLQNQGLHGYLPGLLGSRPPFVDPSPPMQPRPATDFIQPDSMPLPLPHPSQSIRPPSTNFNTRPSNFEGNWQWRH